MMVCGGNGGACWLGVGLFAMLLGLLWVVIGVGGGCNLKCGACVSDGFG